MAHHPGKIVYITAGAGGMYCGSCLRDNSLAMGLGELGWDVSLLPLYTPIRVDGVDHSVDRVFFGGVNVFLQQKIPLFRHVPAFVDRWFDNPGLIRRVASRAVSVSARELGDMTLSMIRGEHGYQRKEVRRLVRWLREHGKPDLICLTNLLVGGCIPALKRELGVPVLVTLQGDDLFLEELQEPWREKVLAEMRRLAAEVDGFITFSTAYRDHMSELLDIPREKFHLTPLGIPVDDFDPVHRKRADRESGRVIGYFARLCPEKGLDVLVDAFLELAPRHPETSLRIGGWLSEKDREFYEAQIGKIRAAGLEDRFRHVEAPDGPAKLGFFEDIDVFSVPARFIEPKGLYALEAMACGLPVVAPERGAFPELMAASEGGLLCRPEDPGDLASKLEELLDEPAAAAAMGARGREWVIRHADRRLMAAATGDVFDSFLAKTAQSSAGASLQQG